MNISILSPGLNIYSETFIKAHKKLKGKIFFYYGGFMPNSLEGFGKLTDNKRLYFQYSILKLFKLTIHSSFTSFVVHRSFIKNKIDVVLAEYGPTAVNILPICRDLNIPLIVHFHGYDATAKYILKKYSTLYKETFDFAYKVIVVSKKMINDIHLLGCSLDKIVYNVYGPSENIFNIKNKYKTQQFLSIGRFVEKKAPHLTILAFKRVVKKFPECKLIMCGDGPLLSICKQIVSTLSLNNHVIFKGIVNQSDIINLLTVSIAFVQHSIIADDGDCEGTPVAILEAMAAGLPVISTNHAGIPDVVIHQKTGLLVDESDVEGMAQNMEYLLQNPDIALKMGDEGKRIVELNYNLKTHLDCLNEIIYNSCK